MDSPDIPEEDASVKRLRDRQIESLAELDEEENRRIKTAFRVSRGARAFRRVATSGNAPSNAAGGRASRPTDRRIPRGAETP